MNIRPIDNYFLEKEGSVRECMLFLRSYILSFDGRLTEEWKYRMPFYYYKGKMLCYLWTNKKSGEPYLGIVDGNLMDRPQLLQEKRNRMKILPIDSKNEIPMLIIDSLLSDMLKLRQK